VRRSHVGEGHEEDGEDEQARHQDQGGRRSRPLRLAGRARGAAEEIRERRAASSRRGRPPSPPPPPPAAGWASIELGAEQQCRPTSSAQPTPPPHVECAAADWTAEAPLAAARLGRGGILASSGSAPGRWCERASGGGGGAGLLPLASDDRSGPVSPQLACVRGCWSVFPAASASNGADGPSKTAGAALKRCFCRPGERAVAVGCGEAWISIAIRTSSGCILRPPGGRETDIFSFPLRPLPSALDLALAPSVSPPTPTPPGSSYLVFVSVFVCPSCPPVSDGRLCYHILPPPPTETQKHRNTETQKRTYGPLARTLPSLVHSLLLRAWVGTVRANILLPRSELTYIHTTARPSVRRAGCGLSPPPPPPPPGARRASWSQPGRCSSTAPPPPHSLACHGIRQPCAVPFSLVQPCLAIHPPLPAPTGILHVAHSSRNKSGTPPPP